MLNISETQRLWVEIDLAIDVERLTYWGCIGFLRPILFVRRLRLSVWKLKPTLTNLLPLLAKRVPISHVKASP